MSRRPLVPTFHDVGGYATLTGGWVLKLGREMASPNRSHAGHWSGKHAARRAWLECLQAALIVAGGRMPSDHWPPRQAIRRRLAIVRMVPSARNFIRDFDNLAFASKELRDSLKALGLIHDDSMRWLDQPTTEQQVSSDGKHWTVVMIEPAVKEGGQDGKRNSGTEDSHALAAGGTHR